MLYTDWKDIPHEAAAEAEPTLPHGRELGERIRRAMAGIIDSPDGSVSKGFYVDNAHPNFAVGAALRLGRGGHRSENNFVQDTYVAIAANKRALPLRGAIRYMVDHSEWPKNDVPERGRSRPFTNERFMVEIGRSVTQITFHQEHRYHTGHLQLLYPPESTELSEDDWADLSRHTADFSIGEDDPHTRLIACLNAVDGMLGLTSPEL